MTPSRTMLASLAVSAALATVASTALVPAQAHRSHHHPDDLTTVAELSGPRGVDSVGRGLTLVTEDDGTFSLVIERKKGAPAEVRELGGLPEMAGFAQAISAGRGKVYFLTGGGGAAETLPEGAATLYVWDGDELEVLADIGLHQESDPDPYDLEGVPTDSNPFGVQALKDGTVLVADAGGNDLLRVWPDGTVKTVAVLKPRMVEVPDDLPAPPAEPMSGLVADGTPPEPEPTDEKVPAEAVATSVTVGADGYWYVGELRGFPATPGTSQVWRIRPGSLGAVCDPAVYDEGGHHYGRKHHHRRPACTRYADGLTSIVDLGADRRGGIYAVSLSKASWLQAEAQTPGSEEGGLFRIWRHRHHTHTKELVPGELTLPGGVDVAKNGDIYLTGPVFGPGALMKLH